MEGIQLLAGAAVIISGINMIMLIFVLLKLFDRIEP